MTIPASVIIKVKINISQPPGIKKNFALPLWISKNVAFKPAKGETTTTKFHDLFSSASELDVALTYTGQTDITKSPVYSAAQKYTRNGLASFAVGAVETGLSYTKVLDKIKLARDFFYVSTDETDPESVLEISTWADTNKVMFFYSSDESKITDDVFADSTTDIASELKRQGKDNTVVLYSETPQADAGWVGTGAVFTPGTRLWAYLNIPAEPDDLTQGKFNNITSKNANAFADINGKRITLPGVTASGQWIDKIINVYYMESEIQSGMLDFFVDAGKVDYDQDGINRVCSAFDRILQRLQKNIIRSYTITVPIIDEISDSTQETRKISIKAKGKFRGAIQTADFEIDTAVVEE